MKKLNITINFDMDGTIADLYGVDNWLEYLSNENPYPYANAEPLLRLSALARKLNTLQRNGYDLAIISWLSKSGSEAYNEIVTEAKLNWLKKHLPACLSSLLGKIIYLFFSHFSLDKVLGIWYNGNNARLGRGRAAEKIKWKSESCPSLTSSRFSDCDHSWSGCSHLQSVHL